MPVSHVPVSHVRVSHVPVSGNSFHLCWSSGHRDQPHFSPLRGSIVMRAAKFQACAKITPQKRDLDHLAFAGYGAYRRQVLAQ